MGADPCALNSKGEGHSVPCARVGFLKKRGHWWRTKEQADAPCDPRGPDPMASLYSLGPRFLAGLPHGAGAGGGTEEEGAGLLSSGHGFPPPSSFSPRWGFGVSTFSPTVFLMDSGRLSTASAL